MDRKANNFHLLRLTAAAEVMVHHTMVHLHAAFVPGIFELLSKLWSYFPGVPVFFTISGFLIWGSLSSKPTIGKPEVTKYARNRCLRIYPALWVCLIVTVLVIAILTGAGSLKSPKFLIWFIVQATTAVNNIPSGLFKGFGPPPNGSLWTIFVELSFYVFLPILYWLSKKTKQIDGVIGFLTIISLLIFVKFQYDPSTKGKVVMQTLAPYLWEFLLGVWIQQHFAKLRAYLENKALYWIVPYIVVAFLLDRFVPGIVSTTASRALLAPVVISCAYSWRTLSDKILGDTDISYGVYLYHVVWINAAIVLGLTGPGLPVVGVYVATVVAALASWIIIEKPALSRKSSKPSPA